MNREPVVTGRDIRRGLQTLGINQGNVVEVHSSLSSFGYVEGGAETVVDALLETVGPQGAIVMSAYPLTPAIALTADEIALGLTWKVRKLDPDCSERTGMGAIADAFRRRDGVFCGEGLHRVCAWGSAAREYSREGYARLLEVDGLALLLGVGIGRLSSMHMAESKAGFPEEISRCFKVPEDIRQKYSPDLWEIGCGGTPDDGWEKVWAEALRKGYIRSTLIGSAECQLFKAATVVGIYEEKLRSDPFSLFGVPREQA